MKRNSILAIILAIAMLVSLSTIPAIAETATFRLEGKVVLPGTDKAPHGGILVTLNYKSDKGTDSLTDSFTQNIVVVLSEGAHDGSFYLDLPYTASADKLPRYTLEYSIPTGSKYWEKGYYSITGMQYNKEGQTQFNEGAVISNLVITPLRASVISGTVGLPVYNTNATATQVEVSAKTTGNTADLYDDFEVKTGTLNITNSNVPYSLRVPVKANSSNTDYIVSYKTTAADYAERGWYSVNGMVSSDSHATRLNANTGNHSNIALQLIRKTIGTTFSLQGSVVLPGNETAPAGGLKVTLKYRSDKGTDHATDYFETNTVVNMLAGAHEKQFTIPNIPFTASPDKSPKFTLEYSIAPGSQYWENGYYTLTGMQYYKDSNTLFSEGSRNNIVIKPLKASVISGKVGLPEYPINRTVTKVEISAKTTGNLSSAVDDFEAKTKVNITNSNVAYSLRVPANATITNYIVMYDSKAEGYEEHGWYSTHGTVPKEANATKLDAHEGNHRNIDLQLIEEAAYDPEYPDDSDYDLNDDGRVDVKDKVLVARAMGSKKKYNAKYDLNHDGVINVKDLKLICEEVHKQNRYRKWEDHDEWEDRDREPEDHDKESEDDD